MHPRSLAEWLEYQQRVHPRAIELGLDRVRAVWERMGAPRPAPVVISVGGTNGKGSTVAFLEAMLGAAGLRVGCYVSPHLLRYNERVRVLGAEAGDGALVDAFERIEAARSADSGEAVALTYFEYGTLAALWIFAHAGLDVAVLEVGLGGRLDAVNIVDADAAIVTTVDLDHQDWLGDDRDTIGREKAGIFRAGRPAIVGAGEAPGGLLREAVRIGADVVQAGRDYRVRQDAGRWTWQRGGTRLELPLPALAAPCQIDNAAAAIAALHGLRDRIPWNAAAISRGIEQARIPARLQRFPAPARPDVIVDVAHNPQAARSVAHWLAAQPRAERTVAVFGALDDKDAAGVVAALAPHVDHWYLAGLDRLTPRGLAAEALRARIGEVLDAAAVTVHAEPRAALAAALHDTAPHGRILAFGSFYLAAEVLQALAG